MDPSYKKKSFAPKPGSHVTLAGGKGTKSKFNKRIATVVAVPTSGCWITIQLHTCRNQHIKWRKGGCRRVEQKQDPFKILDDSVCEHILSYLLENKTEIVCDQLLTSLPWVMFTAGKLHGEIRSVSRRWKAVSDQCLPQCLGLIDANFDAVRGRQLVWETMQFLTRHKMKLGALNFSAPLYAYQQLVDLMQGCDMQHLRKMRAYYNVGHAESMNSAGLHDQIALDLTVPDLSAGYPVIHAASQKDLHDLIAKKCANLTELAVKVVLPQTPSAYSDYISTSLFSMSSIAKLKISLGVVEIELLGFGRNDRRIDGLVFSRLIKGMPGLRQLELATQRLQWLQGRRFHVESENLESLDVRGTSKGVFVSCQCPNLVQYKCLGEPYGNGTRPTLTQQQEATFSDRFNDVTVLSVKDYQFPQLQVSDACHVVLEGFGGNDFVYGEMMNSRYETFETD